MRRIYPQRILGHWDRLASGLRLSALSFYDVVEQTIREREIEGVEIDRITWAERGVLSRLSIYLQLSFDTAVFIVSAIPMGTSTYLSWWLALSNRGIAAWLSELRFFGWMFRPLFRPLTFYRIDSLLAFEQALHAAVVESIDRLTTSKGVRRLQDAERKPIL